MVTIFSFLVGAVFGTRFKVFCLIPTALSGLAVLAAFGAIAPPGQGPTLLTALGLVVGLQLGYLFGMMVRTVVAAARAPAEAPSLRPHPARLR